MTTTSHPELEGLDRYKFGWADSDAAGAAVPRGLLSLREGARCHEVIRAQFGGYERCHRNSGHEPLPHHVRGRSWSGSWSAGTARIQFGVGCDDGCVFGDEVARWGGSGEAFAAPWRRRRPR